MYETQVERFTPQWKKPKTVIAVVVAVLILLAIIGSAGVYIFALRAPQTGTAVQEQFTISLNTVAPQISGQLEDQGFVRHAWAFNLVLAVRGEYGHIAPGGYLLSKNMNAWQVAKVLSEKPSLIWVVVQEGVRKEQIADSLQQALSWSDAQKTEWLTVDTAMTYDYREGVYLPDTYLIPRNETPLKVAERMQAHFEEAFAPYAKEALKQNIRWPTALKVASLIQREAAGAADAPLISGILWNRLLKNMRLDIDATVQYARGDTGEGWWAPLKKGDTSNIKSAYNTYLHNGLPPTPIAEPSLWAIRAALFPATTTCLYYLHDNDGQIHCSDTYAGQQANIEKYLK